MITIINSLVLLSVFVTTSYCSIEVGVPGTLIEDPITPFNYNPLISHCGENVGPICSDDCQSLLACVGDPHPAHVENCEESNRDTPYCVGKVCSRHPQKNNINCHHNRTRCTSEGVFPDPYDCTRYYSCYDGLNSTPYKFKCPDDYVYSPEMKLCYRNARCQTHNCYNYNANKFIPFGLYPEYYAFCGVPIVMFKCGDEQNYVFNSTVNECVYNCKYPGYFIDPANCSQYFICDKVGAQGILQRCPYDYKFNGYKCVESKYCLNVPEPERPTSTQTTPITHSNTPEP